MSLPDISIAGLERRLTPKQAARVIYLSMLFRSMDPGPRLDELINNDPGHRWFCFCLAAIARRESR